MCPDLSVKQGLGVSAVPVAVAGDAAGATAVALCGIVLATVLVAVPDDPEFTKGSASAVEGVAAAAET